MVRKIVLSLIAVLGICAVAMAQNQQVSGTATDAAGAPVAGATVMVDGTTGDLAVAQDNQNPVYYVQYAHARICSIIKALAKDGINPVSYTHLCFVKLSFTHTDSKQSVYNNLL